MVADKILRAEYQGNGRKFLDRDEVEKLFSWDAVEGTLKGAATVLTEDGVHTFEIEDPTRKVIMRPPGALGDDDPGAVLGTPKPNRKLSQFRESLLTNTEAILGDDLGIVGAGSLYDTAVGFIQVTVPESIKTPSGVEFYPFIVATDSHNGMFAQSYSSGADNVDCRNTHAAFLRNAPTAYKLRHSKNADFTITDSHQALGIVHTVSENFTLEVEKLISETVSPSEFDAYIEQRVKIKPDQDNRSRGRLEATRERLYTMYASDERVRDYNGTKWGVIQLENTYAHWVASLKGEKDGETDREVANVRKMLTGDFYDLDKATLKRLDTVLATA